MPSAPPEDSAKPDLAPPPTVEQPPAEGAPAAPSAAPAPVPSPPRDWTPEATVEAYARRRRDKRAGLLIILAAFVAGLALSYWAKLESRPETSEPPGPPTSEGIKGFPTRVEVVSALALARSLTKRTMLRGFVAEGVRSDGTIDLSEGPGRARYAFQSPAGHGPQPPRAPGTLPRREYCGRQDVHLRHEGLVAEPDRAETPCAGRPIEPLPDPQCSAADIWRAAVKRGLPSDGLARIEYYRARGGPAWRFQLPTGAGGFVLYGDCKRELNEQQAHGHVP